MKKNYKLMIFIFLGGFFIEKKSMADTYFNPAMIDGYSSGNHVADLSIFNTGEGIPPGDYMTDIYLNKVKVASQRVTYVKNNDSGKITPCISESDLELWGVNIKEIKNKKTDNGCFYFNEDESIYSKFDYKNQSLNLSFPQILINNRARGWVDPSLWDNGLSTAFVNYSLSGGNYFAKNKESKDNSYQYLNLRPSVNVGPWRLRNYTTWSSNDNKKNKWDTIYSYIQRDINSLKSQLTLGDNNTSPDVFDSVPFRGVSIATNDDMTPESLRGYAPVVTGIARTNARVTIRQSGYIIYEDNVPPGQFEINDLYQTGSAGNLTMTIKEADGSEQTTVIPYASLPILQRQGRIKYNLVSAQYRAYSNNVERTFFSQGSIIYGLSNSITTYLGTQLSMPYKSIIFGWGVNLGNFGAISFDMNNAKFNEKNSPSESGKQYRIRYNKNINETGTNFTFAGYKFSTKDYSDINTIFNSYKSNGEYYRREQVKNKISAVINQRLYKNSGNLSLSILSENYWNREGTMTSYNVGYNNSYNSISYGLIYSYNKNTYNYDNDHILSFNISVPMSIFSNELKHSYANYSLISERNGKTTNNLGVSGSALDNELNWSVQNGISSGNNSYAANASWKNQRSIISSGYSSNKYSNNFNYGIQGSLVAYDNSVILGQPTGDTFAIVSVPHAEGVSILGESGVQTNKNGYAIVPYVSAYRENTISLDTESFNENIEVDITRKTLVPTRGAVAVAKFDSSIGQRILMKLVMPNGNPVPFGSIVTSEADRSFIVSDNGNVFLSGLNYNGTLYVKWGDNKNQSCIVNYHIKESNNADINLSQETCS